MKPTILCIDDEIDNLDALERIFRAHFTVLRSNSGIQALKLLDEYQGIISVILTDQRMPEMTGVEFLNASMSKQPHSVRILLTGYTDIQSIVSAINEGNIYRYLTKPWDPVDLLKTVQEAAEKFNLQQTLAKKNLELETANRELLSLDKTKTEFMMLVNHELRTPLTSLINYLEALKETSPNEEQKKYINRIDEATRRFHQLIEDVIMIIKAETGHLKLNKKMFLAEEIKAKLTMEFTAKLAAKDLTLNWEQKIKRIFADPGYLQKVFSCLVDNAIKFANKGTEISIQLVEAGEQKAMISITNIGKQIEENVLEKIFEPFFIDENMLNHTTGIGLGLPISRSLIELHQSQIKIENIGNGVRFSFEISCA